MKDIYKKGTIIAIILLSIIFIYSYFNVKGNEVNSVSNISLTSSVTITKTYNFVDDDEEIYDLDTEQIAQLKSLISESDFTRTLSSTVRSYDKDTYVIFVANNSQDFQTIKCIGNEYIEVIHQFNGKWLKVKNKEWKNELERIISVSIEKESPEDIALDEAKKISGVKGYSILNSEGIDVLVGDSEVFQFIKDVSIEEGYLEDDFDSISGDRKIIEYELKEKSNDDEVITLGVVVDKGKAIGAYLNYHGYKPNIRPISFKEVPKDEYIVHIGGKYLNSIEFGIGDSAEELVDEWGLPIEVDYFNGGLYLKYDDAVFYTDGYINDDESYYYGSIGAIDADEGFGVNTRMTIDQSREYLGVPDAKDIFDELKEFGEGSLSSTDYYYRDGYTISIPYDKDTKQILYIRLGADRPTPDIIGKGFIELTDWEMSIYENYRLDFDENKLNGLNPMNVMKMWIYALQENDYETEWELFTKEEKQLGWDKEQHIEQWKIKEDFSEFENPINIEVGYDDDYNYAYISWEDKYLDEYDGFGNPFRFSFLLIKGRDIIWKVAFRPMQ